MDMHDKALNNISANEKAKLKLKNDVPTEPTDTFKTENSEIINKTFDDVNAEVLFSRLSPEVTNNEKAKRRHKYILIILLTAFIIIQFVTLYYMTYKTINYAIGDKVDYKILKLIFTFISGYITSVVIELIAILNYIVKNVFDTSIYELVKLFKETNIDEK